MSEAVWHWLKVTVAMLFVVWVVGNAAITYYTGTPHTGEPVYSEYYESKRGDRGD